MITLHHHLTAELPKGYPIGKSLTARTDNAAAAPGIYLRVLLQQSGFGKMVSEYCTRVVNQACHE